ncbi:unnamed protein product [Adineta ricciae]|uniref:Uncharacterized protein n=1 Tax=Adineta ricciae TaxID=249248 RepID=A0A815G660_ADIRI|nr:unnamed protein product [Adineta ricciae]CAF1335043.1 unnamed protein product [Adineta ricciae]
MARATLSKEHPDRYDMKLTSRWNKLTGENSCLVQPDPQRQRHYLIYLRNDQTKEMTLVAGFDFQPFGYDNYLYILSMAGRRYQVQSLDLRNRNLMLTEPLQSVYPQTLYQVNEAFTSETKTYHLTIHDDERQYIFLAITILLHLHERKRNSH